MITHLLDTSAWLAHLFRESGGETISALLLNPDFRLGVSVLSLLEVHARMRHLSVERRFTEIVGEYQDIFAQFLSVDESISLRATTLREGSTSRLPVIDSLIAATAAHHNAVLVHRDAHFTSIPGEHLRQEMLVAGS